MKHIAIVYPSGKFQKTAEEKANRIKALEGEGFAVTDLEPSQGSPERQGYNDLDGITAGPVLERAVLFSHALTNRKFDILMAGRGGYGTTELIPFLEYMLPPVLPPKTLVGFSDISYIGVYLTLKYPNFRYIHAKNAFSDHLFLNENSEKSVLFNLLKECDPTVEKRESCDPYSHGKDCFAPQNEFECNALFMNAEKISGICVPLNLSLAESLASTKNITLPENTILFLEDCHEYVYRLFRKFDSLINQGFMDNVKAVALGDFAKPLKQNEQEMERQELLNLIAIKLNKPVIDFPFFGHGKHCFPLVAMSNVLITFKEQEKWIPRSSRGMTPSNNGMTKVTLTLMHTIPFREIHRGISHTQMAQPYAKNLTELLNSIPNAMHFIHMSGIGGTGMASVAGLLKSAGYDVSGSDNTIYPPMDKILADLQIVPDVGYKAENITKRPIDAIIMGNIMSRKTASLQKNEELEEILQHRIPLMSFPSALRKFFLNKSFNIVISGTHGKTTTGSLFAHLLTGLGENPSFLIGGMPGNFGQGFALNSRDLFVLEGDEYDSALFDKGPKFLHYEPSISIINNIEFDHADIYESIERIEEEFLRLALLTRDKKGFNIVNWSDERVRRIALEVKGQVIAFMSSRASVSSRGLTAGSSVLMDPAVKPRDDTMQDDCPFPLWVLNSFDTNQTGIKLNITAPNQTKHSLVCHHIFGAHNALNILGVLAGLHAKYVLEGKTLEDMLKNISQIEAILKDFKGVKRRFELLGNKNNIAVFEDFAHHPTAVRTTLEAFRNYMSLNQKQGRLIVCFDPHNATMRRNILEDELAKSFAPADMLFLGKIPKDLRMNQEHILNAQNVIQSSGIRGEYFDENQKLLQALQKEARSHDTIVFMSSGSFDGIALSFVNSMKE